MVQRRAHAIEPLPWGGPGNFVLEIALVRDRVLRLGVVEFGVIAQAHELARSVPWPRNGRAPKLGWGLSCSGSYPAVVASNAVCANCYGAGEFDLCCA